MKPTTKLLFTAVVFAVMFFITQVSFAIDDTRLGFAAGNDFKSMSSRGQVTVTCKDVTTPSTFNCWDSSLDPVEFDYFVGPTVNADTVTLLVTREDQSQRSKDSRYDSRRGMSVDRFNLWSSSLFQRPLLADGVNRVHYTLSLKGAIVMEGDFTARVSRQPTAVCQNQSYHSDDPSDCTNQYAICGKYFEQYNHCQ